MGQDYAGEALNAAAGFLPAVAVVQASGTALSMLKKGFKPGARQKRKYSL